ncbi:MAG: PEP-CTERM sorting domain-containing protein [Sphingomonadales bacterium]|nr:PEP-CTERM sorting domain-containing protein [Sphingomonadales bacterium]
MGPPTNVFYLGFDDQITKTDDNHDDFIVKVSVNSPVPEPSTWAMLLFGFGVVGFALRRRLARTAAFA